MRYSRNEIEFAASFEGFSPTAVHHPEDPEHVWTLGFGCTYWWKGGWSTPVVQGMTTDRDTALLQCGYNLNAAALTANSTVPSTFKWTQNEFDAVTDLIYNIGQGNWIQSTARRKLIAGDLEGAASAFEMWDRAGGQIMAGLLRRRKAEEAVFLTPDATTV